MIKYRLNNSLLFTLIIAFVTMQWTSTHIHLAENHNHDGGHHQHNVEVHAHKSIDNHINNIDFSHQSNNLNVVDLDHEVNEKKVEKLEKSTSSVLLSIVPYLIFTKSSADELPTISNTRLNYLFRSITKPRAPPAFS